MSADPRFDALPTPCLLLDEAKLQANLDRLAGRARKLGVALRPHLKTAKSVDVARRALAGGDGPATVSTLAEAEAFAAAGVRDIFYAVGIAPQKLDRVLALRAGGCDLSVLLDSRAQAEAIAAAAARAGAPIPALIEIDSDGHRSGLAPGDTEIVEIGRILHAAGSLRGVAAHAGESYMVAGEAAHAEFAERERAAVVAAAEALRAGVYMFQDLVMAGIGVCPPEAIAVSVLATVIGHQPAQGWVLIDAGWMAMSRDRGTAAQAVDQGYGLVCDEDGTILPDLIVIRANQEHGVVARRPGAEGPAPDLPLGARLRILPNHACATAAQHDRYHVLPAGGGDLIEWPRFGGW